MAVAWAAVVSHHPTELYRESRGHRSKRIQKTLDVFEKESKQGVLLLWLLELQPTEW
jgi:hypothetical protein